MKTLTTLITLILLSLSLCALAADIPQTSQPDPPSVLKGFELPITGFSVLRLDPMTEEIEIIRLKSAKLEEVLLAELFAAQTDLESDRVLLQINQLDMDRKLDILQVQMRYARLDGRFDLEREIRGEIVAVISANPPVLP